MSLLGFYSLCFDIYLYVVAYLKLKQLLFQHLNYSELNFDFSSYFTVYEISYRLIGIHWSPNNVLRAVLFSTIAPKNYIYYNTF